MNEAQLLRHKYREPSAEGFLEQGVRPHFQSSSVQVACFSHIPTLCNLSDLHLVHCIFAWWFWCRFSMRRYQNWKTFFFFQFEEQYNFSICSFSLKWFVCFFSICQEVWFQSHCLFSGKKMPTSIRCFGPLYRAVIVSRTVFHFFLVSVDFDEMFAGLKVKEAENVAQEVWASKARVPRFPPEEASCSPQGKGYLYFYDIFLIFETFCSRFSITRLFNCKMTWIF